MSDLLITLKKLSTSEDEVQQEELKRIDQACGMTTSNAAVDAATWTRRHKEEHAVAKQLVADTLDDLMIYGVMSDDERKPGHFSRKAKASADHVFKLARAQARYLWRMSDGKN